jgi:DNA-binding transcriptional regulator GbsR (MarR family)
LEATNRLSHDDVCLAPRTRTIKKTNSDFGELEVHFWSQQQKDADTARALDELRREIARNADISKPVYELETRLNQRRIEADKSKRGAR